MKLWRLANLKSTGWASKLETQERAVAAVQSSTKVIFWQNSFLLRKGQTSVLFRPSADWMRPTHIMEDNGFTQHSPS